MIDHLIFDTTDFETIDDTHSVGAYVRSGDSGALITHHSSAEAGNITFDFVDGDVTVGTDNIAETAHGLNNGDIVQLTTTGVLPAGLAAATNYFVIRVDDDNFKLASSAINAERGIAVDITAAAGGGTHTVTEQEFDRRALDVWMVNPLDVNITQADEITVFQGTDPWIIGDGGGSITVDAVDLDIRDLTHVSDSVSLGDGTTLYTGTTVGSDHGLDVYQLNDPSVTDTAIATASNTLDVANTAEDLVAAPLANRKYLFVKNNDNKTMYIGATGVTSANGFPVAPGSIIEMKAGPSIDIEWVSSKAGHDARTLELS